MHSYELIVILINVLIISFAYFWLYPKVAGSDWKKISQYDLLVSVVSLLISGVLFWGCKYEFNAIFFTTNWFWFSLIIYFMVELPFVLWYLKKYNVWKSLFDE